ncbi:MAG: tRNA (guanine(10)-N(2))-dimethyltransferase [Promethearchaeota archaeon]
MPVFYNPKMAFNRDLTVVFLRAVAGDGNEGTRSRGIVVCDALAGSGVRAVRVALEVPSVEKVYANDVNPRAVEEIMANAEMNGCSNRVVALGEEAAALLTRGLPEVPNFVDVDPFGSPRRYVGPAFMALGRRGWLGITATDTAVLCGAQRGSCVKNYAASTLSGEVCKEAGLRVLLGFAFRVGSALGYVAKPLLSAYHGHFFRLFVEARRGSSGFEALKGSMGYLRYCTSCYHRDSVAQYPALREGAACPSCGAPAKVAGPLWVGPLHDVDFLKKVARATEGASHLVQPRKVHNFLELAAAEASLPPHFFDLHFQCDRLGLNAPRSSVVVSTLKDRGFNAARTHLEPRGIKTDAPIQVVAGVLKDLQPSADGNA